MNKISSLILSIFSAYIFQQNSVTLGQAYEYVLILYDGENGTGNSVAYHPDDNEEGWVNVVENQVEANGLSGIKSICVLGGVFILYQEIKFQLTSEDNRDDEIRLISGVNICTIPPPTPIGSLRSAATIKLASERSSYVSVFLEEYYANHVYTVTTKSDFNALRHYQPPKSMIIYGEDKWLFETMQKELLCVTPYQPKRQKRSEFMARAADPNPIYVCIVPDTAELFAKGNGELYQEFRSIKKGCDTATGQVIELNVTTCFDYRSGELQEAGVGEVGDKVEPPKPTTNDSGVEGSPFYGVECGDYEDIARLIRLRVTNDFFDMYQLMLPFDKQHIWKTELLDVTMEVMAKLMGAIVPPWFLGSVREFFIYFIEKQVWSLGSDTLENSTDINLAVYETRKCFEMVGSWGVLEEIQTVVKGIIQSDSINKTIRQDLEMTESYDPLTEMVWLSFNAVGAACHQVLRFHTNFWVEYFTVANEMYLKPMVEFWRFNNKQEQKYYPIIFGGVILQREYQRLAVFASTVYNLLKYYDIWNRPEELTKI